ncbi:DNA repair protein Sae2/CtIP [Purpureocillium lavendulum]|uniref:DNA repair protein Sae2/CtIP n=1 Tax=Purpureocillium lavendulum TaxID=1247861 RepID=A0AB34FD51_9HYPO|nr:DNA repair protein Sae2/CtIP [Purpureocillium lavendulum]
MEAVLRSLRYENSELKQKFDALSKQFRTARNALVRRRDERDKWVERADYLEKLIAAAESEHGIQVLPRADPPLRVPVRRSKTQGGVWFPLTNEVPEAHRRATHVENELPPPSRTVSGGERPAAANIQSESTQGDEEDTAERLPVLPEQDMLDKVVVKEEPSSDVPVVVSERVIRKRKHDELGGPSIKPEPKDESSPVLSGGRYGMQTQESLDLGDIEQRMETPRKRKDQEHSPQSKASTAPRPQLSFATPTTAPARPPPAPQSAAPSVRSSALTPLSVNVRVARSAGDKHRDAPRKRRHLGYAIGALAEDGGVYGTTASARKDHQSETETPAGQGRLGMLLNSPSAADDAVIPRSANKRGGVLQHSDDRLPIPQRRELPFDKTTETTTRSPLAEIADASRPPPSSHKRVARDKSPQRKQQSSLASSLRGKRPSELRLDDFKVNPLANDGHDFAFTEVVRDKADRACLPGCTDMHCCGKQFRALALSQRPNPPLTPAQRLEEQKLLEEYLGDYAYRLATMSKEERDELWVEAKAQELANKYGKHRHRFSRMQSPPGFWNADFPSTQELQADKAEAAKREKQAITERYREAMRPGGRWIFKDE